MQQMMLLRRVRMVAMVGALVVMAAGVRAQMTPDMLVAWSPDGRRLAAGLPDGAALIVDGALSATCRSGSPASALGFAPDSQTLLVGSPDGGLTVCDTAGAVVGQTRLPGGEPVKGFDFSPDGRRFLVWTGTQSPTALYLYERTLSSPPVVYAPFALGVPLPRFLADGSLLTGALGEDGTTLTLTRDTQPPVSVSIALPVQSAGIATSGDGRLLVANLSESAAVYDTTTGALLSTFSPASFLNWTAGDFGLYVGEQTRIAANLVTGERLVAIDMEAAANGGLVYGEMGSGVLLAAREGTPTLYRYSDGGMFPLAGDLSGYTWLPFAQTDKALLVVGVHPDNSTTDLLTYSLPDGAQRQMQRVRLWLSEPPLQVAGYAYLNFYDTLMVLDIAQGLVVHQGRMDPARRALLRVRPDGGAYAVPTVGGVMVQPLDGAAQVIALGG